MSAEGKIEKQIKDYVESIGGYGLKIHSGTPRIKGGFMNLAPKGTPDLLLIVQGRSYHIEIKKDAGEVKEWYRRVDKYKQGEEIESYHREIAQYKQMERIKKAGGITHITHTLDTVKQLINETR